MKAVSSIHEEITGKRVIYNGLYHYINDSVDGGEQVYIGLRPTVAGSEVRNWIKIEDVEFAPY